MQPQTFPLELPVTWRCPLPLRLVATAESESFREHPPGTTGLPLPPHPGGFGVVRRHHVHEGVDLYAPHGTAVFAVEAGEVVAVVPFTGPLAGLPWWLDTYAVLVEGPSGVVVYGEVTPTVCAGAAVAAGERIGNVCRVLRHDKGRPTSMLHLELHAPGSRTCPEWLDTESRPSVLRDPTPYLLTCCAAPADLLAQP
ncbi:Peptidase family M23 [compost metagenome]